MTHRNVKLAALGLTAGFLVTPAAHGGSIQFIGPKPEVVQASSALPNKAEKHIKLRGERSKVVLIAKPEKPKKDSEAALGWWQKGKWASAYEEKTKKKGVDLNPPVVDNKDGDAAEAGKEEKQLSAKEQRKAERKAKKKAKREASKKAGEQEQG